jgi:hypothetical protein
MFDLKQRQLSFCALPRNKIIFEKIGRKVDRSRDTDLLNTINFLFAKQPAFAAHTRRHATDPVEQ